LFDDAGRHYKRITLLAYHFHDVTEFSFLDWLCHISFTPISISIHCLLQYHCMPSLSSVFSCSGLGRTIIVRCMGLSYEESVRKSMKWLSFRRSLFTLTSRGQKYLDVILYRIYGGIFFFLRGGGEMSTNRRNGISNIKKRGKR
jgi:hypothetical protein